MLGKLKLDTLNSELAFQDSKNVTMRTPNGGIQIQNQNISMCKSNGELTSHQNQNTSMYASNGDLIRQHNQNAIAMKKRLLPLPACEENAVADAIRAELIRQKEQDAHSSFAF